MDSLRLSGSATENQALATSTRLNNEVTASVMTTLKQQLISQTAQIASLQHSLQLQKQQNDTIKAQQLLFLQTQQQLQIDNTTLRNRLAAYESTDVALLLSENSFLKRKIELLSEQTPQELLDEIQQLRDDNKILFDEAMHANMVRSQIVSKSQLVDSLELKTITDCLQALKSEFGVLYVEEIRQKLKMLECEVEIGDRGSCVVSTPDGEFLVQIGNQSGFK